MTIISQYSSCRAAIRGAAACPPSFPQPQYCDDIRAEDECTGSFSLVGSNTHHQLRRDPGVPDRTMSNYAQQPQYLPPPHPGHSAPYAQGSSNPPQPSYGEGYKGGTAPVVPQWYNENNEEYGTVMQPKKRKFNDVIFLVLFLLTVRPPVGCGSNNFPAHCVPGRRVHGR